MSNCNKDLYDYDLVKKFCKCGIICLKSNFHKHSSSRDGLNTHGMKCVFQKQKQYDIDNRDRKKDIFYKIEIEWKSVIYKIKIEQKIIIYKIEIEMKQINWKIAIKLMPVRGFILITDKKQTIIFVWFI